MKIKKAVLKVKSFLDDEPLESETPKVFKVSLTKTPSAFKLRPKLEPRIKKTGSKFRPKIKLEHTPFMELEELHDEEYYHCHVYKPSMGYALKTVPGYRLKRSWKDYKGAFQHPARGACKAHFRAAKTNWVEVRLPNKMAILVQPRTWTPSYFKE